MLPVRGRSGHFPTLRGHTLRAPPTPDQDDPLSEQLATTEHPDQDTATEAVDAGTTPRGWWPPSTRTVLVAGAVPVAVVALTLVAWAVDTRGSGSRVLRNTELAGVDVGGLDEAELTAAVAEVAARYPAGELVVEAPGGSLAIPGDEAGLALDERATIEATLDTGRGAPLLSRPFRWLASFATPHRAPSVVGVDAGLVATAVREGDPTDPEPPSEPSIRGTEDGEVVVEGGTPGRGLVAGDVVAAVPDAARDGELPVVVEVEPSELPPRHSEADAEELAEQARTMTAEPLAVRVGGTDGEVPPEVQRRWVRSELVDGNLQITWDRPLALEDLRSRFEDVGDAPVDARFTVSGGSVQVIPSEPGTTCCDDGAGDAVVDAIIEAAPEAGPVALPLVERPAERTTEDARALGIREQIGSFTTNYTPGQTRNQNIQRMADLVRGALMEPGERFSINDHVGQRTRDKGFTDGGAIADGELVSTVGGGVSQFATTTFNAAFFAGLEIPRYQMHSIYFERYPYGREATLSFPQIDLALENNTGNGVLVWTSWTDSSVTVTLYGTRTFEVTQSGQSEEPSGNCTRVVTERTRTRIGTGATTTDTFTARYRPGEGVQC